MHIPYEFDPQTVDLLLEGLSELPYKRVHRTIAQMREIAVAHLQPTEPQAPSEPARRLRKKDR